MCAAPAARRTPALVRALLLLALALAALAAGVAAQRRPPLRARFAPLGDVALIPRLLDAAPLLDHRDSASLLSRILVPRVPGTAASQRVADALLAPFEASSKSGGLGWHIERLPFVAQTPHGKQSMTNLVVTKNPASPRRLTLAAHYDSKIMPKGFIGATDSAAPCAILVDTAMALDRALDAAERRWAKEGSGGDVTLQIVFFDGEEAYEQWTHTDSIYGSKDLAQNWTRSAHSPPHAPLVGAATLSTSRFSMLRPARHIDTIEHLVLLDLLGAKSPQIPSYFHPTAWLHDKVRSAQRRLLDAKAFWPPNESSRSGEDWFNGHSWGGIEDDHLPFLAGGVPVLHLIPSPFPRVWHTMGDDASALDYGTDYGWAMIMRLFVAEYLGLGPDLAATAQPSVRDAAEQARRAQEAQREEQIRAGAAIDVEPQGPRPRDELQ